MTAQEQDIVYELRHNPDKGFRLLMDRYMQPVYWHVRRLVVSHCDAQDAVQEAFVRVFRSFDRFDDKHSLSAWIYKIATNEALRIIGRRKESISLEQDEVRQMQADQYVDFSNTEAVKFQRAIQSLPTKQQIVFTLRYYDELEYSEIAEIADCSLSAAKANYSIAKGKITDFFNTHD